MNITQCAGCGEYYSTGNFKACPHCQDAKWVTTAKASQSRKTAPKRRKQRARGSKPLSLAETRRRLNRAGLTDDTQIAQGIPSGATVQALYGNGNGTSEAPFLRYMAIVRRLSDAQPELLKYKNRLVSYKAA